MTLTDLFPVCALWQFTVFLGRILLVEICNSGRRRVRRHCCLHRKISRKFRDLTFRFGGIGYSCSNFPRTRELGVFTLQLFLPLLLVSCSTRTGRVGNCNNFDPAGEIQH